MPSSAELQDRLRQAAELVEQADIPRDFRSVAFEHVLLALGADGPAAAGGYPPLSGAGATSVTRSPPAVSGGDLLSRIAVALGLDRDPVARIYEEDDGQVRLVLKRAMLPEPNKKAASIRHVALLVVVGRQAAGLEEHTSYDAIREECRELKVYDPANFAADVGKLEFRTSGGRNSKEARANRHHYDDAADLIRRMAQAAQS